MAEGGKGASAPGLATGSHPHAAGGPPSAPVDPLIGRTVNERFKITGLIARGGMGRVYRAEQAPLGRICALKILTTTYEGEHDPEFHKRFFLEASIASKITHPNSVTIFDYGQTEDDIYYMAMEYLEGVTLHRAIRMAGFFPEARVAHVGRQVCRALREAHRLGCIHRDLKPANVFLTEHGDEPDFVKVLDFGLVKNVLGDGKPEDQLTQTGLFMGSPKYMAPEQIRGEKVDARTDVYSLGIIMYEMLTGKVPFERQTSLNTLMAQVNDKPPRLLDTNPNAQVSPELEDLVLRCMAKNPDERATSMDEVLATLKRIPAAGMALSGEYRALGVSSSGAYSRAEPTPNPTHPPASFGSMAVSSGSTSRSGPIPGGMVGTDSPSVSVSMSAVGLNGRPSVTPMAAGSVTTTGSVPPPNFRAGNSRTLVFGGAGVLTLALLGAIAVRATSVAAIAPVPSATIAASPALSTPPVPAATPSTPLASAAPTVATTLSVHFVTDPPGASVKEGADELCAATPCDHGFPADMSMEHKVTITRPGYKPETRVVHGADAQVAITLVAAKAWTAPARQGGGGTPKPADSSGSAPQGFKDIPY